MTTVETPPLLRHAWKAMLAWGALTLILRVVMLVWPGKSILVAAVLFGIYLIASGIAQVVLAFALAVSGGVLLFISGALSIVLGVFAFRHFYEGWPIVLLAAECCPVGSAIWSEIRYWVVLHDRSAPLSRNGNQVACQLKR